ncbi:MAG: Capsular polysaccharide biosynthesis protein [candidate division WWE3 bacterium GW2011_GWA2_46_9]|uniref:Capsular polysaccharide biosynthesis protein n=1 Tax=candidate division WWE3 bacterium GW2011_GWA2_46_9 TaxID=1619111 RepID=A0A0G1QWM0_UNCKA|nr:MAG: Capsular polysaccharide biosynthesis protein [candidate division WWE3 bacterium GW2011_GWA2_46_9]
MFKRITNLLKTNTFQGIAIVTGGLFVGNVLSYLLQILLARFLSVSEYGIFTVLLSLSYIFTIPSTGVSNAIIKLVSELRAAGRFENLTAMFWKISALAFISGVAITAGLLAFRVPLAAYLNLESPNLFFYFGIFLVFLLLIVIPTAYLQGLLRFKDFAIFVIVGGLLRVLFPLILIFSGFGVRGVFVGMGLGFGFAYLCALLLLRWHDHFEQHRCCYGKTLF